MYEKFMDNPMFLITADLNHLYNDNGLVPASLALLRASFEGDWHLHRALIRKLIPLCFAYDKTMMFTNLFCWYVETHN